MLAFFVVACFLATAIPLIACILWAKHHDMRAVALLLPANHICRAIVSHLVQKMIYKQLELKGECLNELLDQAIRNLVFLALLGELMLFVKNIPAVLLTVPVNLFYTARMRQNL